MQIEKQLQSARERLLDLTLRNRLLNFRPSKRRTIQVVDEIPKEIFNILVLKERVMQFKPAEQPREEIIEDIVSPSKAADVGSELLPWLQEPETAYHHTDRLLQTNLVSEELQKRLYYVHHQARSVFEEQGYSVLHLALGFLKWQDPENAKKFYRAPLILMPVELERQKVRTQFKLRWSGADLFPNLSLEAKLVEQGLILPDLETPEGKEDIDAYFQKVSKAVSTQENWHVVPDIYLDFFSFTKFVMYKDLEPEVWSVDNHPLLGLILGETVGTSNENGFKPEEVDLKLSSQSVYHVMDADSSQIAVIEDIKKGKNLVVEGPPGTGKSQTITNIIAELLAGGKKVLFVSEKMAALEVVKNRLDRVGLGDFCLELHSRKSNKREVIQELERTVSVQLPPTATEMDTLTRVDTLKADLNGYVNAIHEPIAQTQKSPFNLYAMREAAHKHFKQRGCEMPTVQFPNPSESDLNAWNTARQQLEDLAAVLPLVTPIAEHPWRGCATGAITHILEAKIYKHIGELKAALDALEKACERFVTVFGVQVPKTLQELQHHLMAADVIKKAIPVETDVLLNPKWDTFNDEAKALIEQVEVIAKAKRKFRRWTLKTDPSLKLDTDYILKLGDDYDDFSTLPRWRRMFNWKYQRKVKSPLRGFYRHNLPKDPEVVRADMRELANCIIMKENMEWAMAAEQTGPSLFGKQWQDEESDPNQLRKFAEWIVSFRHFFCNGTFTEEVVDIASEGVADAASISFQTQLEAALKDFEEKRDALLAMLRTDCSALFNVSAAEVLFDDFRSRLELWKKERAELLTWGQFSARHEACRKTIAQPLLTNIGELVPEDLVPYFEGNLATALLDEAAVNRPALGNFVSSLHEKKIADFHWLDSKSIVLNQHRLSTELHQRRPHLLGSASRESESGILQGQFNRKSRHMPIRRLLSTAGGLIQRIKPCFMMSPLSVAQFCDPKMIGFDVIVFDEASQIRPEDALGALMRAKQAVVIGDTRQLPPTRFFDSIIETADEAEVDDFTTSIVDVESILHQCRQCFPVKQLKWHYRSRHESLIAISNQEFYQNNLLIFPSPVDKAEHLGLKFVHIPEAVYDRGQTSTNKREAERVVKAAFAHYREYPDKSLGIGTFNMKQQQAILDEVENQLYLNPEMSEFFASTRDEQFFVKNLETIQGDERDTIFLSIGYGKDADGRLYRNFGPLNHEGGERRLNVLITRARERCVVFSNFRSSDLQLDANAPFGTKALKMFLDYAENRNLEGPESVVTHTESAFEESVYQLLKESGYTVRKQIGCAEYRIDLAVVDPLASDRYLLGIECDGFQYRNAPVARDRDRLRQQVLRGLGWQLHRVWLMDWYRDRARTVERLLAAIEHAKTVPPEVLLTETAPEPIKVDVKVPETEPLSPSELNQQLANYVMCTDLSIPIEGDLPLQLPGKLAKGVVAVVQIESPVHIDEVVLRVRNLWGLGRSGNRIRDAIGNAISKAQRNGHIRRKGDFLWRTDKREIEVRQRETPKIEWICDEEIAEAMKHVIRVQGALSRKALRTEAIKLFGYKTARETHAKRLILIRKKLVEAGELQLLPNGIVRLP